LKRNARNSDSLLERGRQRFVDVISDADRRAVARECEYASEIIELEPFR
jgi:hypothetical protein